MIMLKDVVSISGKPGLFKLISRKNNIFIAESLVDQKRIPVNSRDKVISLEDITVYTNDEAARLSQVFESIKMKENSELISFSPAISPEELRIYFSQVIPNFNREKVYPSDIKKMMNWYNILINAGITVFLEETGEIEETGETGETGEAGETEETG